MGPQVSEGAHGLAVRRRRMVSGLVELGRPVRHAQRAPRFFSAGAPCTGSGAPPGVVLALVVYKVPSMGCRSACKSLPQVCPPMVFLGRCSLYRQRSAARFHWFLSRGLKTLRPGVHADDMIFGIRLRLEMLL